MDRRHLQTATPSPRRSAPVLCPDVDPTSSFSGADHAGERDLTASQVRRMAGRILSCAALAGAVAAGMACLTAGTAFAEDPLAESPEPGRSTTVTSVQRTAGSGARGVRPISVNSFDESLDHRARPAARERHVGIESTARRSDDGEKRNHRPADHAVTLVSRTPRQVVEPAARAVRHVADATSPASDQAGPAVRSVTDATETVTRPAGAAVASVRDWAPESAPQLLDGLARDIAPRVEPAAPAIARLVHAAEPVVVPLVHAAEPVVVPLVHAAEPVVVPLVHAAEPVVVPLVDAVAPVVDPVADAVAPVTGTPTRILWPLPDLARLLPRATGAGSVLMSIGGAFAPSLTRFVPAPRTTGCDWSRCEGLTASDPANDSLPGDQSPTTPQAPTTPSNDSPMPGGRCSAERDISNACPAVLMHAVGLEPRTAQLTVGESAALSSREALAADRPG